MSEDRAIGALVGLAIGDALGTTNEFAKRDSYTHITDMVGGGPFKLKAGEWTDDTSMALALGESIINNSGRINQIDILKNFVAWWRQGKFSHNGKCFDIGFTTICALEIFEDSNQTRKVCGDPDPMASGNGGIMRMAPAVICATDRAWAMTNSINQSKTTHSSPACVDVTMSLGLVLWELIEYGSLTWDEFQPHYFGRPDTKTRDEISSSGYVLHTVEAALWCLLETDNFNDAVLLAANLGDDADTVAAVTGQLAGALYGFEGINKEWVEKLAWKDHIISLAKDLYDTRERIRI